MSPEDLLADLPPVRDDEPSSLRRDIADELADHLECAVRREQVKSNGADDVERRVLERFGNPRQIARRLWWLAMWSRIMSQRVLLGVSLTGNVLAILLSVAVFWQFGRERDVLSRERAALALQLADQRVELITQQSNLKAQLAVMAAALEQVQQRPATSALPPGEPTLKVRLEGPEPGSPPPEFSQVSIKGLQLRNQALERTNGVSRKRPEVDFGKVVSGGYRIGVIVASSYEYEEEITLDDGDVRELVIRCPDIGPQVWPTFVAELPPELTARGMIAYAEYELLPLEVAGHTWHRAISDSASGRGFGRNQRPYLARVGVESTADDSPSPTGPPLVWNEDQYRPDSFSASLQRFRQGASQLRPGSGNTFRNCRVRLSRLVLVDDVLPSPTKGEQNSPDNRAPVSRGPGGRDTWSPTMLVFDGDRLGQFPTLIEPIVLTDEPVSLSLPDEMLRIVRSTLDVAYAADAAVPTNRKALTESTNQQRWSSPFESRGTVIRP